MPHGPANAVREGSDTGPGRFSTAVGGGWYFGHLESTARDCHAADEGFEGVDTAILHGGDYLIYGFE
jgi:hypothetical protein